MKRCFISLTMVLAIRVPGLRIGAQESAVNVAPALTAQADARLSRYFKADQPGAAVLLMQDGKVLFKKGYGLANVELNVAIQPDMVFRIGSGTKQFTAAAIIFPDQVNEAAALLKSRGPQTGIKLYEREWQGSVLQYLYRLGYGDKHVILRVSLMEDNRISAVDFYLE